MKHLTTYKLFENKKKFSINEIDAQIIQTESFQENDYHQAILDCFYDLWKEKYYDS